VLFRSNLKLKESNQFDNGCVWIRYSVEDPIS
jgi:hypothetical protein